MAGGGRLAAAHPGDREACEQCGVLTGRSAAGLDRSDRRPRGSHPWRRVAVAGVGLATVERPGWSLRLAGKRGLPARRRAAGLGRWPRRPQGTAVAGSQWGPPAHAGGAHRGGDQRHALTRRRDLGLGFGWRHDAAVAGVKRNSDGRTGRIRQLEEAASAHQQQPSSLASIENPPPPAYDVDRP